jgi:hypothetical protein
MVCHFGMHVDLINQTPPFTCPAARSSSVSFVPTVRARCLRPAGGNVTMPMHRIIHSSSNLAASERMLIFSARIAESSSHVLLVCYSDDIDAVGEQMSDIQYVQAEFHKRSGVTTSSPDFMLGVRRTFSTEGDTRVLEFSTTVQQQAWTRSVDQLQSAGRRSMDKKWP